MYQLIFNRQTRDTFQLYQTAPGSSDFSHIVVEEVEDLHEDLQGF